MAGSVSPFFAYLARLRLVQRWGLMRSFEPENVAEHSHQVAVIAHALALISVRVYGGSVDPSAVATAALFHDASEVLTGDLPTPIKYATEPLRDAYKDLEQAATTRLLEMLPRDLQGDYDPLLNPEDPEVVRLIRAADQLCAYLKAVQETKAGNQEFSHAVKVLRDAKESDLPEVEYFLEIFGMSFLDSLDGLGSAKNK